MLWFDWVIVIIPVAFVLWMGFFTRRYLKDVTTFLSAGRVCGRYVISVGDIANAISIIGLLAYVEVQYKTGFALGFWNRITTPISIFLALYGYCFYRFRETKAQSLGQFLEIRYSRKFRIFAASLRSLTEMLANMIMPALAARFFMYFLDLPEMFSVCGISIPTFNFIMLLVLVAAISIICMGGSMAIIVTDTIQGFICYPLMVLSVIFLLYKFSWSNEIMPVLSNRAVGENFLNPYEVYNLRDFNFFFLIVSLVAVFLHRTSCLGKLLLQQCTPNAGSVPISPEELKTIKRFSTFKQNFKKEITEPVTWRMGLQIPVELFVRRAKVKLPLSRQVWTGNVMKCADWTSHPTWLCWYPSSTFHCPDEFGTFIFE